MTFQRTITGDFTAFRTLQSEIIAIAEDQGFAGNKLFAVKLAIEDSLIDAIKRFGTGSRLVVDAELSDSGIKLAVREAG